MSLIPGTRPTRHSRIKKPNATVGTPKKNKANEQKDAVMNSLWPLKAMEPKVWVPYVNPPDGVPRRIVIDRKRREYLSLEIDALLKEKGIDFSKPVSEEKKFESYLPLEAFDDTNYDPRTPQEWMSLAYEDDEKKCIPAIGLFKDTETGIGYWKDCRVVDCNFEENSYSVLTDFSSDAIQLPRIFLMFKAEDPRVFCERVYQAHQSRANAANLLRYHLYIDNMPTDEIPSLTSDRLQVIRDFSLNTDKLIEHEDMLSVDQLIEQVNIDYCRTMNKIVFDTNMKSKDQQELYSFLSLPEEEEEVEAPWSGVLEIPAHNFSKVYEEFHFKTYFNVPCVSHALLAVRSELLDAEARRVFALPMKKIATLDEFDQIQKNEIEKISKHLQDVWVKNIVSFIKDNLKNAGKGGLNVYETNRVIYEMSKLKKFMTAVRFMMEDSLRFLTEDSLREYVNYIIHMCAYNVTVKSVTDVESEDTDYKGEEYEPKLPLFAVELVYREGQFKYSTDPEDFIQVITHLFDQAVLEMQTIPQAEAFVIDKLFWSSHEPLTAIHLEDTHVKAWKQRIHDEINSSLGPLHEYIKLYSEFESLIKRNVIEFTKGYKDDKTIEDLKKELASHRKQKKDILKKIPQRIRIGPFCIDCQMIRQTLSKKCQQTADYLLELIAKDSKMLSQSIVNGFVKLSRELNKPPQNIEELTATREFQSGLGPKIEELVEQIATMRSHYDLLDHFKKTLSDEEFKQKCAAIAWPKKFAEQVGKVDSHLIKEKERFRERMQQHQLSFQKELDSIDRLTSQFATKHTDIEKIGPITQEVKIIQKQLKEFQERAKEFRNKEILFEIPPTEYKQLNNTIKHFTPFANLWLTANDWINWQDAWLNDPFETLDAASIEKQVKNSKSVMAKCVKQFAQMPVMLNIATQIRDKISEFEPNLPLLLALRNPGIRERHWKQMSESIGLELQPGETIGTLQDVFELNLINHIEKIQKCSDVAAQEYTIEKSLTEMKTAWENTVFDIRKYRETGTYVLKVSEEFQQQLDDHITLTQTISFSTFKKFFETDIMSWDAQLNLINEVIEEWINCQREWMALEPIFSAPEMIKQLPQLHKKFKTVDSKYRKSMQQVESNPNVLAFCSGQKVLKIFQDCNMLLNQIQKGLNNYLETKRKQFARLYFLADDELLLILAQAQEPRYIQPYLKKCFSNIEKLHFEDNNDMTRMYSPDGEGIDFVDSINAHGSVEVWLEQVEGMMKESVKHSLSQAIQDYANCKRTEWVLRHPGQIIITGSQIFWTKRCEEYLTNEGFDGLKTFTKISEEELNDLSNVMMTNITNFDRNKLSALITIDVHARDVLDAMVEKKVCRQTDFTWVSQMRYYWEEEHCTVRQVESSFDYGYEYLGNTGRLVITPLTDRIYLTLTGALHLNLGGAPAGPAGTGKTETVKDLAKALAKQCVVFNCQEGLDEFAMGKFFKGLIMAGAWACFDEFNRIDVEVLSVVAQQITTLQEAVRAGLAECEFENTTVTVDPTYAVFITMNPGYAGRTELPDNLKALFRPVACMVPDYALIAEIRLFSFGFLKAKPLSQKMVATFRLSSEQLSSQDHYDFGMRALNTVIAAAGILKREDPSLDEEILLLRALRDSNLPKFLPNDVILFDGIISDLFPGVKMPTVDYGALIEQLKVSAQFFGLQPTETFLKKCIQLHETTVLRHGLMIVGLTMGGKTANYQTLAHAITKLSKTIKDKPEYATIKYRVINPKSVTMAQLYGEYDRNTREWKDGILANEFRTLAADTSDTRKWLIFDGPVDALWIESMNTVLDDNRKLCLVSGAIIEMSSSMNIIFEVRDLAVASPATVSRCGMVYMAPGSTVPVESLVKSWIQRKQKEMKAINPYVSKLTEMFENVFTPVLQFVATSEDIVEFVKSVRNNLTQSCFNILDSLLSPYNVSKDSMVIGTDEDEIDRKLEKLGNLMEPFFIFSVIWSIGASCDEKSRTFFDKFLREQLRKHDLGKDIPTDGLIYDYQFDQEMMKWITWMETEPEFTAPKNAAFRDIVVPTTDTIRYNYLLDILMSHGNHVLCIGPTGTGKSLTVSSKIMTGLDKQFMPLFIFFSARTDANSVQNIIDGKLDKHRKGTFGPPLGKTFVIFVDDLNMPQLEEYGAQPPIELLRQWMDHGGWYEYNSERLQFRKIVKVQFAAAMGLPGGGRNAVTNRFLRHFNHIAFPEMSDEVSFKIFNTILSSWTENKLTTDELRDCSSSIIRASIGLYNKVRETMLPTPSKSHYTFNLRDLSKVVQGMMGASPRNLKSIEDVLRLWIHESSRVFSDRLVDDEDRAKFKAIQEEFLASTFQKDWNDVVPSDRRLLFGSISGGGGSESEYEEIKDMKELVRVSVEQLDYYNDAADVQMNLVLFLDAIEHVSRISRIIRQPGGNALLLGVGGSGRQSLSKLAASMADYEVMQIEVTKSFGEREWKDFLKRVMLQSGKSNQPTVLLFTDTQLIQESFLEDINNLLNAGDIPNIMDTLELEEIYNEFKPICAVEKLPQTPPSLYARFVKRVKENLHAILAMSPTTDIFRTRLRMFPSLVTCCTIDWFSEWPTEGLLSVAKDKLMDVESEQKDEIMRMCVYIHESVAQTNEEYWNEEGRSNHVTPTSYLELLQTFDSLLKENRAKILEDKKKFDVGLSTLKRTEKDVAQLQKVLEDKKPILKKTQEDIKENMEKIEIDKLAANETKEIVSKDEEEAAEKERECKELKDSAQQELDKALPLLDNAVKSLKNLKVESIKEVSSYKAQSKGVLLTVEAVCVMLGKKAAKIYKDGKATTSYWEAAKPLLNKAKELRNQMIGYDKDNIPEKKIQAISKFINNPEFTPKEVSHASKACTAMCEWVRAMYNYYHVSKEVEPKRQMLAKTNKELAIVQKSLEEKRKKLDSINSKIQFLEDENEKALKKQEELAAEVEECTLKLSRANRLITGLAGEKIRWIETLEKYAQIEQNMVGDMLLAAGSVAYMGPFTAKFRQRLATKWGSKLKELNLLYSDGYNVTELVAGLTVREWNQSGLPSDSLSIQNAVIMSKARRWPLMIDPQVQANRWIRQMEKENGLKIITFHQKDYLRTILNAVQFGNPVLLENIGENLDPAIEPILLKQTFIQNGVPCIRIGDDVVQFNQKFRLYMTTKLRNPMYTPETSVRVTLLNFFITPKGLEDQLLGTVVRMETPELEQQKNELMKQNVKMQADLVKIQNNILKMLNEADENILANEALINALEESKIASETILEKVAEAEKTEKTIDLTRNQYTPVAYRGSILFFAISDLANIDPMYQYSLQWFQKLFVLGIEAAEEAEELDQRLTNLIEYFTYSLYNNICQSLFATHKLLFSFILTIRILMGNKEIDLVQWRFLLTGQTSEKPADIPKPDASWITDNMWKESLVVDTLFPGFIDHFQSNLDVWHKFFDSSNVHELPIPDFGVELQSFQQLLILRALRPDKVTDSIMNFVTEKLGKKFVMPPRFDLARSFKDSSNVIPLIMILSPGADPKTEMNKFAEVMRIKRFSSISLGRGTEKKASQAVKEAIVEGTWVLLQNCHLATSFMDQLEAMVEEFSEDNHRDFRLWLTSMPSKFFPVSVLQNAVKCTLEPPRGLQANLMGTFDSLDDNSMTHETKPVEFKKLLYSLSFLHAIVQERRKFGPLGWNIPYEFTNGDLFICIQQLNLFLEKYDEVPYEVVQFLSGQINYGGRVTDDWDRRTLMTFVSKFLHPDVISDDFKFSSLEEYYSLPPGEHKDYVRSIEDLPLYTPPETFGLHENAEITYNISELIEMTTTITSMQPRGKQGGNKDEVIKLQAQDITKIIPLPFDDKFVQEKFPTRYDDCMNTVIVQEVIRYNRLLKIIHSSLDDLVKAIEGLVVMSDPLEKMYNSMFNNQVPEMWSAVAYPSLMPLADWVQDLASRCEFIQDWVDNGHPKCYWISGFFFPQAFLTGTLQNYARKHTIAIDRLSWDFEFLDNNRPTEAPEDGAYIDGLFLEGADWDPSVKHLVDPKPKQLFTKMPIIWLKCAVDFQTPEHGVYVCPTYKTLQRAGTLSTTGHSTNFVLSINVPIPEDAGEHSEQSFWIRRGVAMVCGLRFASKR